MKLDASQLELYPNKQILNNNTQTILKCKVDKHTIKGNLFMLKTLLNSQCPIKSESK